MGVFTVLGSPPGRLVVAAIWAVGLLGCTLAAANRSVRFAASVGSVAMLAIATLTSSFGQVFHTEHLLVIHLLILAAASLVDEPSAGSGASGWPLQLMMSSVVVAYVVAGVAKLRSGGTGWLTGDVLRNWVAVDNLRKVLLDDPASTLGGWLAGIGWIWAPIAIVTLAVELGAPIALLPGRPRHAWLVAAWLFHVGVLALMAISFPYQLTGVAYLRVPGSGTDRGAIPSSRPAGRARASTAGRRRPPGPRLNRQSTVRTRHRSGNNSTSSIRRR